MASCQYRTVHFESHGGPVSGCKHGQTQVSGLEAQDSHSGFLSLNFIIYKMGMVILILTGLFFQTQDTAYKAPGTYLLLHR